MVGFVCIRASAASQLLLQQLLLLPPLLLLLLLLLLRLLLPDASEHVSEGQVSQNAIECERLREPRFRKVEKICQ